MREISLRLLLDSYRVWDRASFPTCLQKLSKTKFDPHLHSSPNSPSSSSWWHSQLERRRFFRSRRASGTMSDYSALEILFMELHGNVQLQSAVLADEQERIRNEADQNCRGTFRQFDDSRFGFFDLCFLQRSEKVSISGKADAVFRDVLFGNFADLRCRARGAGIDCLLGNGS